MGKIQNVPGLPNPTLSGQSLLADFKLDPRDLELGNGFFAPFIELANGRARISYA
ncbi:MAG: hypothetical protein LPJ92_12150 [Rhodobacterales bacterium]|nr:hypothetical protein [Rhodobacterales bacterium]MDX5391088.1 hypothetical protein [Rhodobacterales bacterium]MDX5490783.1 hypothetical protein [Rhodobacterales bacterium]